MLFYLRKIEVYFQNFFYARSNRLFRQSQAQAHAYAFVYCKKKVIEKFLNDFLSYGIFLNTGMEKTISSSKMPASLYAL